MESRTIGTSSLSVWVVGLGCNNFGSSFVGHLDLTRSRRVVDAALDAGVNFLDTADYYGDRDNSEAYLGEILEGRRDRLVVATKFGLDMGEGSEGARGSRPYSGERWRRHCAGCAPTTSICISTIGPTV